MGQIRRAVGRLLSGADGFAQKDNLGVRLLRGGIGSIALKGANALLMLATTAILARNLTVEAFGIYAYVLATTALLAIPAHAGIPTLIVRMTATYRARTQWGLLNGLWIRTQQFVTLASLAVVVLTIAYFALVGDGSIRADRTLTTTVAIALLIVPVKSVAETRAAAMRGLGHVVMGQAPDMLFRPAMFLLLLLGWLLSPAGRMTPQFAMALHAGGAVFAMAYAIAILKKLRPPESSGAHPEFETAAWKRSILPLSMLAGAQVILQQTGSVMLGALSGVESVGLYRVAIQSSAVVGFALLSATTVLSPHLARLHAINDSEGAQSVITGSSRVVFGATLGVALLFVLFGQPFIELFFGRHYLSAYAPLVIICLGLVTKAAAGPAAAVLTMTGHERDAFAGVAASSVANIILSAALIPKFGMNGAALASALAFAVWSVTLTRMAHKRTGFDTTVIGIWRSRTR